MSSMQTITETEYLYSSLAGDPDLTEIVDLFVEEMPERVQNLADLLAQGDWAQLRRYAHQMKGACGSYGFHQLTGSAARLESAVREQEEEQAIREAVDELVTLCNRVRSTNGA